MRLVMVVLLVLGCNGSQDVPPAKIDAPAPAPDAGQRMVACGPGWGEFTECAVECSNYSVIGSDDGCWVDVNPSGTRAPYACYKERTFYLPGAVMRSCCLEDVAGNRVWLAACRAP